MRVQAVRRHHGATRTGEAYFVAEIRDIFTGEEIGHYLDHLERMAAIESEQAANEEDDELLDDSHHQRAAKRVRLAHLRELLSQPCWGRRRERSSRPTASFMVRRSQVLNPLRNRGRCSKECFLAPKE